MQEAMFECLECVPASAFSCLLTFHIMVSVHTYRLLSRPLLIPTRTNDSCLAATSPPPQDAAEKVVPPSSLAASPPPTAVELAARVSELRARAEQLKDRLVMTAHVALAAFPQGSGGGARKRKKDPESHRWERVDAAGGRSFSPSPARAFHPVHDNGDRGQRGGNDHTLPKPRPKASAVHRPATRPTARALDPLDSDPALQNSAP